jgi:hypothetical protein
MACFDTVLAGCAEQAWFLIVGAHAFVTTISESNSLGSDLSVRVYNGGSHDKQEDSSMSKQQSQPTAVTQELPPPDGYASWPDYWKSQGMP